MATKATKNYRYVPKRDVSAVGTRHYIDLIIDLYRLDGFPKIADAIEQETGPDALDEEGYRQVYWRFHAKQLAKERIAQKAAWTVMDREYSIEDAMDYAFWDLVTLEPRIHPEDAAKIVTLAHRYTLEEIKSRKAARRKRRRKES